MEPNHCVWKPQIKAEPEIIAIALEVRVPLRTYCEHDVAGQLVRVLVAFQLKDDLVAFRHALTVMHGEMPADSKEWQPAQKHCTRCRPVSSVGAVTGQPYSDGEDGSSVYTQVFRDPASPGVDPSNTGGHLKVAAQWFMVFRLCPSICKHLNPKSKTVCTPLADIQTILPGEDAHVWQKGRNFLSYPPCTPTETCALRAAIMSIPTQNPALQNCWCEVRWD